MNITAFMNLMVILVPFLLITAVFTRMTILELNLPPASSSSNETKQELQLEVTIRKDALEVGDRHSGLIKRIDNVKGYDYKTLSEVMKQIKSRFPDKLNATILSEPDTSYDVLVQVMDAVRVAEIVQAGSVTRAELFPDVSIGDAPVHGKEKSP
ncbi:MAG: biopolymer transporter ExbD [Sulfuricaulis sp.]|uniref:ExbD/TolR family protein n=1 Tax=Sulfuricaulis sp. TaxID=2003553 RepID=UPI003C37C5E3